MKTITIDIGNSGAKVKAWDKDILIAETIEDILKVIHEASSSNWSAALSCVGEMSPETKYLLSYLKHHNIPLFNLKDYHRKQNFLEMPVHYAPSLGSDRLVLGHACFQKYHTSSMPQQTSLVIDSGSFTTIDIITKRGFMGGYILPGMNNWVSAYRQGEQLHNYEEQIQKHLAEKEFDPMLLPSTSTGAMGDAYYLCTLGSVHLLSQIHQAYRIILTGGRAQNLYAHLKTTKSVSIEYNPDLMHQHLRTLANDLAT